MTAFPCSLGVTLGGVSPTGPVVKESRSALMASLENCPGASGGRAPLIFMMRNTHL